MKFIDAFSSLPQNLYKSAYVDLLLFVADLKSVVRIDALNLIQIQDLMVWGNRYGLSIILHREAIYIGRKNKNVLDVITIDNSLYLMLLKLV